MKSILVINKEKIQSQAVTGFQVYGAPERSIKYLLNQFSPISLDQLGKAALMDRQDTKFIFREDQLINILPGLESDYRVLSIKGQKICSYRTVYYDTDDFHFFQQHQIGSGRRWKIRQRTYLDSQLNFLEVKYKDNRKRTRKNRIQIGLNSDHILANKNVFLTANAPCSTAELRSKLEIRYSRITLVKKDGQERVTLDSKLHYSNGRSFQNLDGLMIAEVKQAA